MSLLQWLAELRDDFDLPDKQWRVATMLALRLDWPHGRTGYASVAQLRQDADASKQTVWRSTKRLCDEGRLKRTKRGGHRGRGGRESSQWAIVLRSEGSTGETRPQGSTGETLGSEGSNDHAGRFHSSVPPTRPSGLTAAAQAPAAPPAPVRADREAVRHVAGYAGLTREQAETAVTELAGHVVPASQLAYILKITSKAKLRKAAGLAGRGAPRTGTAAAKPPWCGKCDEHTRQTEDDQGRPARCPDCHPLVSR